MGSSSIFAVLFWSGFVCFVDGCASCKGLLLGDVGLLRCTHGFSCSN